MPLKINNLESDVIVTEGETSARLMKSDIENIVREVMERIRALERIDEEAKITNMVSKKDFFD